MSGRLTTIVLNVNTIPPPVYVHPETSGKQHSLYPPMTTHEWLVKMGLLGCWSLFYVKNICGVLFLYKCMLFYYMIQYLKCTCLLVHLLSVSLLFYQRVMLQSWFSCSVYWPCFISSQ